MIENKPYVYVLVRKDIPLQQQLVQSNHAAWEAGLVFPSPETTASLIVLEVPNRNELEAAAARLSRYGIDHVMFNEPDWEMGHSAIATCPLASKKERHLMRKYPLWQGVQA
ncbi:hypothetical protein F6X40_27435 [Paraburkholderia sp. UCT31]|uniref:hypothetical protein n=1 Tax=Paraburkholderia sp. UCT31 TaxID=2615209 RepID=UPI00165538CF|nr:hypothetical protein [Paraburkholderia sp. UCT31]MBC8740394.1 hypothetical protein [Paraburkholderia sp. UCT31]